MNIYSTAQQRSGGNQKTRRGQSSRVKAQHEETNIQRLPKRKEEFWSLSGQMKRISLNCRKREKRRRASTHEGWRRTPRLKGRRDASVLLTCSEGDEGRGMEPSSFRCLLVSFASWLVECWICCLWTHHQSEKNRPAAAQAQEQNSSHTHFNIYKS